MSRLKRPQQQEGKHFSAHDSASTSTEHLCPAFSLRHLRRDFCISKCTPEEKAAFADTLHKLSQLSWAQIRSAPRHGSGCEKIEHSSIRTEIPSIVTKEVSLLAFRFYGKAPMIGFRDKDIFHILWFDRDFTVYPH